MRYTPIIPIMAWDSQDVYNPPVIWWQKINNQYQVEVRSISKHHGELLIFDHDNRDECVYNLLVRFRFDSLSQSPDVSDIARWEELVEDIIDSL